MDSDLIQQVLRQVVQPAFATAPQEEGIQAVAHLSKFVLCRHPATFNGQERNFTSLALVCQRRRLLMLIAGRVVPNQWHGKERSGHFWGTCGAIEVSVDPL